MNNNEIWHRWEPIESGLNGNYFVDHAESGLDGFRVLLAQDKTEERVTVFFSNGVLASRFSDEGMRTNLFRQLSEDYGTEFYANWSFFKVDNSSYIKWLSKECFGVIDGLEPKHFVIMGQDLIVDMVASYEPQVTILPATESKLEVAATGE